MSLQLDPEPTPPQPPEAGDCCGSGCVMCVFDYYDEQLQRYEQALAAWKLRRLDVTPIPDDSDINKP